MHRPAFILLFALLASCATSKDGTERPVRPVALPRVNVLPLALDDAFSFRKTIPYHNTPGRPKTRDEMITARQKKINYGAIDNIDIIERRGNYYTFYWRATREANLSVRLEYRTRALGDYVQAREISYQNARGTNRTDFEVIGNDYQTDGPVTAWRALLIEDGKIVALTQSYLWN